MITQTKPLNEITTKAIHILTKEFGIENTIRFFNQFTTGYGNYTEERKEVFGKMSVKEIVKDLKKGKK
ncbi:MAG: hypothetical protein L3J41_13605 [Melioribacteraceae bacterium]|nr:hypothetical protein [Melioribacteraceae bacterium]